MYEIKFSPRAEKFLKKLKNSNLKKLLQDALIRISQNPYIGEAKKGDLNGFFCYDVYYDKTNYEIAYRIYEDKIVVIILVGTRENFYNELKKLKF
ncbi:MAG: type II toxin-antitoxin system RelE/ParE family toxin [Oscillospiraceae bacterium]|nr:type II toxin-antitoxin system RelE/ParE family toxin [Oscillospiraceae bacterium]